MLYDEAEDREISRRRIKNSNIQKFLEKQYTLLVLYKKNFKTECVDLLCSYENFRQEIENGQIDFDKLSEMNDQFEALNFYEEEQPECEDSDIDALKCSIVQRVAKVKEEAKDEIELLKSKKEEVEELVKQKLQKLPEEPPASMVNDIQTENLPSFSNSKSWPF